MHGAFIDTWAYRALADSRDAAHQDAKRRLVGLRDRAVSLFTSNYVLDEAYTGIRRRAGADAAIAFGDDMRSLALGGDLRIEWIDRSREDAAWQLFRRYRDLPKLSFTDCTSFALMRELAIDEVLTDDVDFEKVNLGFLRV